MKFSYWHDENDTQGPWVLLCRDCIIAQLFPAEPDEITDWIPADEAADVRCACCGATADQEVAA